MTIRFSVSGIPVPQGSKRWLPNGRLIEANAHTRPWRATVADAALSARQEHGLQQPLDQPCSVSLVFLFPRPASHYGKRGTLRPSAPQWKSSKPDVDKLSRAILDGLTHVLIRDDAQVVSLSASKRYMAADEVPAALITLIPHR